MTGMRVVIQRHWVTGLVLAVLTLGLLACSQQGPAGSWSPSGLDQSEALVQTAAAVSTAAQAAHNANAAEATRIVELTRQAEAAAAATAANQATGTADAIAYRVTEQALIFAGTATAQAFETGGTATAHAVAAEAADQSAKATAVQSGVNAEATRQAAEARKVEAEAERAENWARFTRYAPWLVVVFVMVVFVTGVGIYIYRHRPMVGRENGREHLFVPPTLLHIGPAPRRAIDVTPEPLQIEAPEERLALPGPRVIHLPDELPEGKIGVGVLDGDEALWLPVGKIDMLGAGIKGSGKSTFVRSLAYQYYVQYGRRHLYLADAEEVTFTPAVWGPVARTVSQVEAMLAAILQEFDNRFALYGRAFEMVRDNLPAERQFYVDTLADYNRAARMFNLPTMTPMLLVWDEANNHIGNRVVNEALHEVLRRNRKAECGVDIVGHYWHAKQVGTEIRGNLQTRAVFRCHEETSRVLLGHPGATKITGPGRAIFVSDKGEKLLQTYLLPAGRVLRDVQPGEDDNIVDGEVLPPVNFLPQRTNGHSNGHSHGDGYTADDPDAAVYDDLIRQMAAEGHSRRHIEQTLFNHTGGYAHREVKRVLGPAQ